MNWTVRTRIIAAFAVVISIMAVLGAVSFVQLRDIQQQAELLDAEVLPGMFLSSELHTDASGLVPVLGNLAQGGDERGRQQAREDIERILDDALVVEGKYRPTARSEEDRRMLESLLAAHTRFRELYDGAVADNAISDAELRTSLRPQAERFVLVTDSLLAFNRNNGIAASGKIQRAVRLSVRTLVPALIMATLVAIVCAWLLVRLIQKGLSRLMDVTQVMSAGDFRQRVKVVQRDELGLLGEGINRMADDLTSLIGQVQRSGIQVNSSATEIAATSKQQQATATEIAATTAEVGATASRISATSRELARTVQDVSEVSTQTAALAQSGQGSLQRMEASMQQIGEASNLINSRLALLSEKAANIGMVVTTINKVADQTNLLSLNAAIEAEKAGEHGRGFAVVAREIRRLADQTAVATLDIEQLVKEMQSAVSAGVMGMDKFSEEVRRGGDSVRQVTTQLSEIIEQVQTITPSFEAVNEGVQSQSISAQQISDALAQLSLAAQQTADSLRQSNMAIDQLNDAARGLQSGVSRFTLAG